MDQKEISFIRQKDYCLVREIKSGGSGKTVLLYDDIIKEHFICKKYSPQKKANKDKLFKNFINEIKILYKLHHPNIVRIFSYYLYPASYQGYIIMEYIEGKNISDYIKENPDNINSIFLQTIEGFKYLEEKKILHRDIRPDNLLVTTEGNLKIIDFGFGKYIDFGIGYDKSISLNWPYAKPDEFQSKTYDHKTELYFVGQLFETIIKENKIEEFIYFSLLSEMINPNYEKRISSFFEILRKIITNLSETIEFEDNEKRIYQNFANELYTYIAKIKISVKYISDIDNIITNLDAIYKNSMLEEYVQNSHKIVSCFINGGFYFDNRYELHVETLKSFLQLLKSVSLDKKKIIINNLWNRLDKINRCSNDETYNEDDEIPF